jgi:hypothetical protein
MKSISVVLILSLFIILSGCAALKVERNVQGNIFHSSNQPNIRIKTAPDFKFFGRYKENKTLQYAYYDTSPVGKFRRDSFLFGHIGEDNSLKRGVVVSISTLNDGTWLPDIYANWKNKLDSGFTRIHGDMYQYSIQVFPRVIGKKAESMIIDNGHRISNCYLVKAVGRIIDATDKSKISIFYFEDINYKQKTGYICRDWKNFAALKKGQIRRLQKFRDRSETGMQILPYHAAVSRQTLYLY